MTYFLYSLFFFIVGFIFSNKNNLPKIYQYCILGGIIFFWGLSYIYAVDTDGYIEKFYYDIQTVGGEIDSQFEIGYTILAMIAKTITPHYWFFQLIVFLFEVVLIYLGLQKFFDDRQLTFILPLLFFLYPVNLAAFRQGIAISLFIFALHFINDKSLKSSLLFFVFIAIASLFHQSALMLVIVYASRFTKKLISKEWICFAVLALADIIWISGISLTSQLDFLLPFFYGDTLDMGTKYAEFIEYESWGTTYGLAKALEINVTVIFYFSFCKNDKGAYLLGFILLLYVIIGLGFGGMIAHRLNYYWSLLYYVCFIHSIVSVFKKYNLQLAAYLLIAVYMLWFYIFNGGFINQDYQLLFNY